MLRVEVVLVHEVSECGVYLVEGELARVLQVEMVEDGGVEMVEQSVIEMSVLEEDCGVVLMGLLEIVDVDLPVFEFEELDHALGGELVEHLVELLHVES